MRAANIFIGFVFALWVWMLWIGIGLMKNMAKYQHAYGYPNADDIRFWIDGPAAALALLVISFIVFNFVKRSPCFLATLASIAIMLFFFYLFDLAVAAAI